MSPSAPGTPPTDAAPRSRPRWQRFLQLLIPGYGEQLGPALWILFFARIINVFAFSSAFPFLAKYLAKDRGLSASLVGAIYMVQGVAGAAFQVVGGELADRLGRRAVIVWSLAIRAVIAIALGVLIHETAPVEAIVALIFLNALLAGLYMPAADALVVDHAQPEARIAAFAHQRVAVNVGWALGPLLGGLVAGRAAFSYMFFAAAPLIVLGSLVLSRLEAIAPVATVREHPLRAIRTTLEDPALRLQLLGALLTFLLAGQLIVTLSVDATTRLHLNETQLGLVWTMNGALVVFAQMPIARMVQRLGTNSALRLSSLVYAAGYTSLGFIDTYPGLLACIVAVTFGELLNAPSQQTAVAERVAPASMARALGLLGLTVMLGRSVGPFVGGLAHDAYEGQPRLMWALLGALGFAAFLVYMHPSLRKPAPVAPARTL